MNDEELNTRFANLSEAQRHDCLALIQNVIGNKIKPANDLIRNSQAKFDDSSDEDEIAQSNSKPYQIRREWNRFKDDKAIAADKLDKFKMSFVAHAIGILALYSPEVESIYRGQEGLKSQFLKSEDLLDAVENAFADCLKKVHLNRKNEREAEILIKLVAINYQEINPNFVLPFDLIKIAKDEAKLNEIFAGVFQSFQQAIEQIESFDLSLANKLRQVAPENYQEMKGDFVSSIPEKIESSAFLQGEESFVIKKESDLFASLRLMQRSGKRQEKTFDVTDYLPQDLQVFALKYDAINGLTSQQRNVANWGGKKTSEVFPYGDYESVASIVKRFGEDQVIANLVLNIFDETLKNKDLSSQQIEYVVAMHHLFFGDEVEKNPACYLANKAAFEMIAAEKMTWDEFLSSESVAVLGEEKKTTPAVLSGENSVEVARALNELYRDYMPIRVNHSMPRITDEKSSNALLEQMVEREYQMITKWLNVCREDLSCRESSEIALDGDVRSLFSFLKDSLSTTSVSEMPQEPPAKRARLASAIQLKQKDVEQQHARIGDFR